MIGQVQEEKLYIRNKSQHLDLLAKLQQLNKTYENEPEKGKLLVPIINAVFRKLDDSGDSYLTLKSLGNVLEDKVNLFPDLAVAKEDVFTAVTTAMRQVKERSLHPVSPEGLGYSLAGRRN